MLAQLRKAEEEAAALRKQLADLQAEKVLGRHRRLHAGAANGRRINPVHGPCAPHALTSTNSPPSPWSHPCPPALLPQPASTGNDVVETPKRRIDSTDKRETLFGRCMP